MISAAIPSPPIEWSRFTLGPLTIHAYALCILVGIVLALWLTGRRLRARGGTSDTLWDIAIWAIPFGIVGGRLYHVLITDPMYYFGLGGGPAHLAEIPQLWLGGLGIMGAVALGAVGAWIGCRRIGIRLSAFADAAAPGVLLAQAAGRWGNWFNQELFGSPTTLPWGLEIDPDSYNFPAGLPADTLFHPTFLYESLWNVAGVILLLALDRKYKLRRGAMFACYVIWYGIGRTIMESFRIDPAEVISLGPLDLRIHQLLAILLVIGGVIGLAYSLGRLRSEHQDTIYLPGREPVAEAAAVEGGSSAMEAGAGRAPRGRDTKKTGGVKKTGDVKDAGTARDAARNPDAAGQDPADGPGSNGPGTAGPAQEK